MIRSVYLTVDELERVERAAADQRIGVNTIIRNAIRAAFGLPPVTTKQEALRR